MPASSTYLNSQQFLIDPFQRLRFVIQFVLMTELSWFAVIFMFRNMPASVFIWEEGGIWDAIIGGTVTGTMVGATQWFVLRKYIPSWLWIAATAAGWLISTTASKGWLKLIMQSSASDRLADLLSTPPLEVALALGFLVGVVGNIWLGLTQWLVLRQYVRSAWWWTFLPLIVLFPLLLMLIVRYFLSFLSLGLSTSITKSGGKSLGISGSSPSS